MTSIHKEYTPAFETYQANPNALSNSSLKQPHSCQRSLTSHKIYKLSSHRHKKHLRPSSKCVCTCEGNKSISKSMSMLKPLLQRLISWTDFSSSSKNVPSKPMSQSPYQSKSSTRLSMTTLKYLLKTQKKGPSRRFLSLWAKPRPRLSFASLPRPCEEDSPMSFDT